MTPPVVCLEHHEVAALAEIDPPQRGAGIPLRIGKQGRRFKVAAGRAALRGGGELG